MLEAFLCTPRAHFRNDRCNFSILEPAIFLIKLLILFELLLLSVLLCAEICLIIGRVGSQSGAPYSKMGFIRLSNSVFNAVNESLDLITVLFKP